MVLRILFAVLALCLLPVSGRSATVTLLGINAGAWAAVDTATSGRIAPNAKWRVAALRFPNVAWPVLDPCRSACSPFDPGIFGSDGTVADAGLPGWQDLNFWAIWAQNANEAVLAFRRPQIGLQFLWGSPDRTNLVEFMLGDAVVSRLTGEDLPAGIVRDPGQGAALLRVRDVIFDQLRFTSQHGAFELSNITTVAPVPLPPALALLTCALGAMAVLARRHRRHGSGRRSAIEAIARFAEA